MRVRIGPRGCLEGFRVRDLGLAPAWCFKISVRVRVRVRVRNRIRNRIRPNSNPDPNPILTLTR